VDRASDGWKTPVPLQLANRIGSYHPAAALGRQAGVQAHVGKLGHDGHAREQLGRPRFPEGRAVWAGREVEESRARPAGLGRDSVADGTTIILEVSRVDSATKRPGPSDLWASVRTGDDWSEPRPLGAAVNTDAAFENFPAFSASGSDLLFVRDFSRVYRAPLAAALSPDD
jgi:hypothetical protein